MAIVGGLDIHRRQITYDYLDSDTGEARRGRIQPAGRAELRAWLARFVGKQADFAFEGTTGWRFVAEEVTGAGFGAHLAEPADTRALRGPKRRAKTDRADARHLRDLLLAGTLPESWIPPAHLADLRTRVRLRKALLDERTAWRQRIHAVLFHHGLPERPGLLSAEGRAWLARVELPGAARDAVDLALRMIDRLDAELDPLDAQLLRFARRQPGCRALMRRYGVGALTAAAILAELGDARRFASSRRAVRFTGLDVTVAESDGKRTGAGSAAKAHRCCAGRSTRRPYAPPARAPPTMPIGWRSRTGGAPSAPPCRWPVSSPARPTTPCGSSATRPCGRCRCSRWREHGGTNTRGPTDQLMWCGWLPNAPVATLPSWAALIERAAAPAAAGNPITHHVAGPRSEHPDKAGRPRAALPAPDHPPATADRAEMMPVT